jgi:hypothetical protein
VLVLLLVPVGREFIRAAHPESPSIKGCPLLRSSAKAARLSEHEHEHEQTFGNSL